MKYFFFTFVLFSLLSFVNAEGSIDIKVNDKTHTFTQIEDTNNYLSNRKVIINKKFGFNILSINNGILSFDIDNDGLSIDDFTNDPSPTSPKYKNSIGGTGLNIGQDNSVTCYDHATYDTGSIEGKIDFNKFFLSFSRDDNNNYNYYIQASCMNNKQPDKVSSVSEKEVLGDGWTTYSEINDTDNPDIDKDALSGSFFESNPKQQPKFVDIAFLQLRIISNLNEALDNQLSTYNIVSQFDGDNYNNYTGFIEKFGSFTNKQDFVDSFEGSITLKDIGVGADIIKGLSCKLNGQVGGSCGISGITTKDYNDDMQFYELEGIAQKTIDIGENAIQLYNNMNDKTGITNDALKNYHDVIFSSDNVSNIGNGIGQRKSNISDLVDVLKNNIGTSGDDENSVDSSNIKGIYNVFYQVNHLVKGIKNDAILKSTDLSSSKKKAIELIDNNVSETKQLYGDEILSGSSSIVLNDINRLRDIFGSDSDFFDNFELDSYLEDDDSDGNFELKQNVQFNKVLNSINAGIGNIDIGSDIDNIGDIVSNEAREANIPFDFSN